MISEIKMVEIVNANEEQGREDPESNAVREEESPLLESQDVQHDSSQLSIVDEREFPILIARNDQSIGKKN